MAKINLGDISISSPAFDHGGKIPDKHTANGDDVSPELRFANVPDGTQQLAVICHDPDAPLTYGFTHWVVYGIPAGTDSIPEGGGSDFTEGQNNFGNQGYGGPAPPPGHDTHYYYFHIYALDSEVDAGPGLTREELLEKIDDHIIEQNRVVGTYEN